MMHFHKQRLCPNSITSSPLKLAHRLSYPQFHLNEMRALDGRLYVLDYANVSNPVKTSISRKYNLVYFQYTMTQHQYFKAFFYLSTVIVDFCGEEKKFLEKSEG